MSELPEPLVSADCDLRGYEYMPLHGQRLFGSAFYSMALQNPRAGLAAQKLWWEAWTQKPAGSLPGDDFTLCRLADFGCDLKAWKKARGVALYGFVLCSDGRYYHPFLCEQAVIALEKREKDRRRKAKWRAERDGTGHPENTDVPRDTTGTETGTVQGPGRSVPSEGTRRDETRREAKRREEISVRPEGRTRDARSPGLIVSNPCADDPPSAWLHLADKVEVSQSDGQQRPCVGGSYLHTVAARVCECAGLSTSKPYDWTPVIGWLRDGYDPAEQIYPAIKRLASRPGYEPPRFLSYFDKAIRELKALSA